MGSSRAQQWGQRVSRRRVAAATLALLMGGVALGIPASAHAAQEGEAESLWKALTQGDPTLNMRFRIEIANFDTLTQSEAYTLRTRLGYGTKSYHGFSAYGDFENIAAIKPGNYWDVAEAFTGQTPIADPPVTEVNQAYLKLAREDMLDSTIIGGRQRIILDDSRFVGNVGWRQNEQTYDSVSLKSSWDVDGLQTYYGYLWEVHRIFGNVGSRPATRDFDSNSHLLNASFDGFEPVKVTAFIYLLDLDNSPANSSASYGFRLNGSRDIGGEWTVGYLGSYAYQMDYGSNNTSYSANYVLVDGRLGYKKLGALGFGFEMLGSDGGNAQFRTPLATLHKFNGWADVFLDNGGPAGLRDFYAYLSPKLPYKFIGKLVYHHFRSDDQNDALGNELDVILKRPITTYFDVLTKVGWFKATSGSPRPDVVRWWLDFTLKF